MRDQLPCGPGRARLARRSGAIIRWRWWWCAGWLLASLATGLAEDLVAKEYQIKAAYLYNFAIKTAYQDFRKEYHEARRVPEDEDTFLSDTLSYTPEEPEDGLLSKALDSAVASVLDDSPGSAAYCLYNVAGLSIPEISSILGITQKSCYKFLEKISLKITKKVRESILVSNCYNTAA